MKYEHFDIECPNCHVTIHVPTIPEVKPMTEEDMDREIALGWIECWYLRGEISFEEKEELEAAWEE